MTKFEHLQRGILALSRSREWATAAGEWSLETVYFAGAAQTCLCTHSPIIEICVLLNEQTRASVEVGNCCVKRFLKLPSDTVFDAIKRIQKDPAKALNEAAIDLFHRKKWLTDYEAAFCRNTRAKRSLSGKQAAVRQRINKKVLDWLKNQRTN